MTESTVLDEPRAELEMVQPVSDRPAEEPAPVITVKRPRRFRAGLRANGLRYLVLVLALGFAWGLVRAAAWEGAGTPEATFMLVLAGGLLAAGAKTAIDILNWAEATRQIAHVERMRAVQRLIQRARVVREQAVLDWRRIHTVLVDHLTGQSQEIRLFHDHDETDRQAEALFQKALSEELWIRSEGVDAVRSFKRELAAIDYKILTTEADFLAALHALMNRLRRDLSVAAIGVSLD